MIVDFHTHIFPPEVVRRREVYSGRDPWFAELYAHPRAKMATADDLIASMAADGVDASVAFPFGWRDPGLIEACNSYVIQAMRDHPGKIIGLAAVQPLAVARAVAELERCARAGMPGFGELMPHGQGFDLGDTSLLAPLVEAAQALGLFALTHASEPVGHVYLGKGDVSMSALHAFLAAFPTLKVVAAHWGGGFPFYELMPEVRALAANLWYDSAASAYLYRPEVFAAVARMAGAHKILWGSDFPLLGQRRMLDYARAGGLREDELALALGGNAAELLGDALRTPQRAPAEGV
ncbi:MAG TPA: amidohydrolase family protein [Ktedonobacterales bacterium]|nr:amidohydrolase family protein [Ktedonobacterales bacterium]